MRLGLQNNNTVLYDKSMFKHFVHRQVPLSENIGKQCN